MRSIAVKIAGTLAGSFVLAIAWPNIQIVSAAPRTVIAHMDAFGSGPAPIRFNLVGATVTGPLHDAAVRTSADGVTWSEWMSLESDPTEGPDGAEARRVRPGTEPIWVGDARFVQTRGIGGGSLHLLNVRGDADDPNFFLRAARGVSRWARGSKVAEAAGAGPVGIYTRAQWGADESLRTEAPDYATQDKMAILHHTDGTNDYSAAESAGIIRAIYYYHVKVRGFRDIAYNFLVDKYGQLFEGRWGGMDKTVVGAHAAGFNTGTIGVAALGTYTSVSPTTSMRDALVRLLDWKLTVHAIMPRADSMMTVAYSPDGGQKWPVGTNVKLHNISAHRDVDQTSCNGDAFYRMMQYFRDNVRVKLLPPGSFVVLGMDTYRILPGLQVAPIPGPVYSTWATGPERVRMGAYDLNAYKRAALLPFRDGSLVQGDTDDTLYIVSSGKLRAFTDADQLVQMGFHSDRIIHTTTALLSQYPVGEPVQTGTYPDGVVLHGKVDGRNYMVDRGSKRPIPDVILPSYQITSDDVVPVDQSVLDALSPGPHWLFRDGTLMRGSSSMTTYIITGGQRRPFESSWIFDYYGYSRSNIRYVGDDIVRLHPLGGPITGH